MSAPARKRMISSIAAETVSEFGHWLAKTSIGFATQATVSDLQCGLSIGNGGAD